MKGPAKKKDAAAGSWAMSLVEFYRKHAISPVRQDIRDLDRHYQRREALYGHLGILPSFVEGKTVLEIGPGSGHNSLYTASLRPSRYVLIEPNPAGVADIQALFSEFPDLKRGLEIVAVEVGDYREHEQFDFVLCEGVLGGAGISDPDALLRQTAHFVAPGGVLVITCLDNISYFPDTLRRLLARLMTKPGDDLAAQVAILLCAFGPHLSELKGMSRRHDDWIIDNLINPASGGRLFSIPDALAAIPDDFEVLGSSPHFVVDWRWYKEIPSDPATSTQRALEQYWENAHNLLDFRHVFPARPSELNRHLDALCGATRTAIQKHEHSGSQRDVEEVIRFLGEVIAEVDRFSRGTADALREVHDLLSSGAVRPESVTASRKFAALCGRVQQYLSFSRPVKPSHQTVGRWRTPDVFPFEGQKRILLVEPPFYRFFGYKRWHYPVTLTLVGSFLEKLGHEVQVYDADKPTAECASLGRSEVRDRYPAYEAALANEKHPIWGEVGRVIGEIKPDVVGITSITAKIDSAQRVARNARRILGPAARIMLGGPHVQGMLSSYPGYDFGPDFDEIVPHIPRLVDQTPQKELLLDFAGYSRADLSSILTSSGCPNACTFCCHSYDNTYFYRGIGSVREELESIKRFSGPPAQIYIMDDCFLSNTRRFTAITGILERLKFAFTAASKVMALTGEKVQRFASAGGVHMSVGVESGSQRILDRIRKNVRVEEIVRRTAWLNGAGLSWAAYVMVGFPFETVDDLRLTEELLHRIRPTFVSVNMFTPYPGTALFNEFFIKRPPRFLDVFQLAGKSCVSLPRENMEYIDRLFSEFDEYNRLNKSRHQIAR